MNQFPCSDLVWVGRDECVSWIGRPCQGESELVDKLTFKRAIKSSPEAQVALVKVKIVLKCPHFIVSKA